MKSFVITLSRRPDRLERFYRSFPSNWPYEKPLAYKAITGAYCNPPSWWKQGGGAWGCYKSHLNIIENELNNENKQDILIFEDDAIFCENFVDRMQKFLSYVPKDADQIYLGGQHLRNPIDKKEIYLANNINRTHAYIVTQKGLLALYKWLNETKNWINKCHIDHHYGIAHRDKKIIAYTPKEWLVGQREDNKSDVSWKPVKERWWQNISKETDNKPIIIKNKKIDKNIFVFVIGLHRSGSSCAAMILHKLGIDMGENLGGYEKHNGGGGEDKNLALLCERAAKFPSTSINMSLETLEKELKNWIDNRIVKCQQYGIIPGGKYPHLCSMGDLLIKILGDRLRIIHCDRPIEESIYSLKKRSKIAKGFLSVGDNQCENVQRWLYDNKINFLNKIKPEYIYTLKHSNLMNNTRTEVMNIIEFLNIQPSEQQIEHAIKHVK